MGKLNLFFATFAAGAKIDFDERTLFLGGVSFRPRPKDRMPGTSSPQWVKRLAASEDKTVALSAGPARISNLGDEPGFSESCTQASKECELRIIKSADSPAEQDEVYTVELLAVAAEMNFEAENLNEMAIVHGLKATTGEFDPDPDESPETRDAKIWRTVSTLSESMFENFTTQSSAGQSLTQATP